MSCSDYIASEASFRYSDMLDALADMAIRDAFLCTIEFSAGLTAAGLMFYFGISSFLTLRTGSPLVPVVMTILIGPLVLSAVPATAIGLFQAALAIAFGLAPAAVLWRLDR